MGIGPVKRIVATMCLGFAVIGCARAQPAKVNESGDATKSPASSSRVATANSEPAITAYANGNGEIIVSRAGEDYLRFGWGAWGPNWGWTGLNGTAVAKSGVSSGAFTGNLGNTNVPLTLNIRSSQPNARQLKLSYTARVASSTPLTLVIASFNVGKAFDNNALRVSATNGERTVAFPLARQGLGEGVRSVKLTDAEKRVTTIQFDQPVEIQSDGGARVILAKDQMASGADKVVNMTIQFPEDVRWFAGASEIPDEPGLKDWYVWKATGDTGDSLIGMKNWNPQPAGRFGRISRQGAQLIYNTKPIKLWGLNLSYGGGTAPEKPLAEKRARFYQKYGINSVRLHKWADGPGWQGIVTQDSAVEFDPQALDRFDYQIAKLKEAGIFVKLSATFGSLKLGTKDRVLVPWLNELGDVRDGRIETPHSAVHYSPDLQNVQIQMMVNLLRHRNPYTKLPYAEEPAVAFVEIINEQSILFWTSMDPLKKSPTLRREVAKRFTQWLRVKYKTQAGLEKAWGAGGLNAMASEIAVEGGTESLAQNNILPLGNPWYWDPDQLEGSQKPKRRRLLDTLQFLTQLQDEFYARYTKAMRDAGYKGELVASNWQAGRALSHFANLHSDALIGTIDRHNYFGSEAANATMISRAGSGLLSSGMQQVADTPFMLSEWIHTFPNEYGAEGPAIIGAYGMGLQGWDASYLFQNSDNGTFSERLGNSEWDVAAPHLWGIFPAVSRQVLRGDVVESKISAPRNVNFASLFEGKLGFEDKVVQGYDNKELDSSKVPARALAVARNEVVFNKTYKDTPVFSLDAHTKSGALVSSTNQLRWIEGTTRTGGYFTTNTSSTKAVVGFAGGRRFNFGNVLITPRGGFASIYLTVRDPQGTLDTAKDLLIVALARARNTGQQFSPDGAALLERGQGPIIMEPVRATFTLKRAGTPQVFALDQDGKMTATKIPVKNGVLEIDTARDKTPYYLVRYP